MANITGDSQNVYINAANLSVADASKKITAPYLVLSSNAATGTSLTTTSNVGISNTAPVHTLDIGTKVSIDESGATTLRVRGSMVVDDFSLGSITKDHIVFNNGEGLVGSSALTFDSDSNTFTLAGPLVAQANASIADTLTLSKSSGTALVVSGAVDINSTADISDTLTLSKSVGTGLKVNANADIDGTLQVNSSGSLYVDTTADITDTLTLSKSSGTGLKVDASAVVDGSLTVGGDLAISGNVTAVNTTNLEVDDPIVLFGSNVSALNDTGMIFGRPSGESNVAMFVDRSDANKTLTIGLTDSSANETEIQLVSESVLPVKIQGSLQTTGNVIVDSRVGINKATPEKDLDIDGEMRATTSVTTANVFVTAIYFN